ncbi:MAG: nucleotidyltransferase [Gemmatimonadaceae bacterium]
MPTTELRRLLDDALSSSRPHAERLAISAAVVSAVLREHGMEATLVGGGAIEFHAGDVYTTSDIDLIVEGKSRAELDAALTGFGFARRGRHWVLGDLFVEVPGNWMPDPIDVVSVGTLPLRVVKREVVLADRVIGFKHWRATAYGAQAAALLALFGAGLDDMLLRERVRAEDAEDALDALRLLAAEGTHVTEDRLQALLDRL